MTPSRLVVLVILSAVLSAGLTSWLTRDRAGGGPSSHPSAPPSYREPDFHQWLHANLELTAAQQEALNPVERRFEEENARLVEELDAVSARLAHALGEPSQKIEDLRSLLEERHQLQGQLQELVIAHLLEKRDQLTDSQRERYRQWIHRSIRHDHED